MQPTWTVSDASWRMRWCCSGKGTPPVKVQAESTDEEDAGPTQPTKKKKTLSNLLGTVKHCNTGAARTRWNGKLPPRRWSWWRNKCTGMVEEEQIRFPLMAKMAQKYLSGDQQAIHVHFQQSGECCNQVPQSAKARKSQHACFFVKLFVGKSKQFSFVSLGFCTPCHNFFIAWCFLLSFKCVRNNAEDRQTDLHNYYI